MSQSFESQYEGSSHLGSAYTLMSHPASGTPSLTGQAGVAHQKVRPSGLQPVPFEVALDRVKSNLNIVEVVGRKVTLKKHGRNYLGLCPFHQEKTPSFNVSETKGLFKCFGCGAGGDALKFLMDTDHLSFPELIEQEANALGLMIVKDVEASKEAKARRTEEDRLLELLQTIQRYYHQWLLAQATGSETQRYLLEERAFPEALWRQFGLGLALREWDMLYPTLEKHLQANVASPSDYQAQKQQLLEDLQHLGFLVARPDGKGHYDRFRYRLMVPIHNAKGQVVAFGGRVLHAEDTPKYMNSPEHRLYQKSDLLYGLHLAKKAMHDTQEACIVEGYFDAMRLHQFGWHHTVATCGTAFTEGHLALLQQQGVKRVYLAFDNDKAGQKATLSAIALLNTKGLEAWVLQSPEKDPDAWLAPYQARMPEAQALLTQWKTHAMSPAEFQCQQALLSFIQHEQLSTPQQGMAVLTQWFEGTWNPHLSMPQIMQLGRTLIPLVAVTSPIEGALLSKRYAPLLGVTSEIFQQELQLYRQHHAMKQERSAHPKEKSSPKTSGVERSSMAYDATVVSDPSHQEAYPLERTHEPLRPSYERDASGASSYPPHTRETHRTAQNPPYTPGGGSARYAKQTKKGKPSARPQMLKASHLVMQDETPVAPPSHDALSRETERYKTLEVYLFLLWWVVSGQARLAVWQVVQETIWPQLDQDSTLYKLWQLLNQWFESAMLQQEHLTQQDCLDILVPLLKDKPSLQRQTLHLLQQIPKLTSSLPWIDPLREPHGQDPALLNRFYHILMEWQLEWKRLQVRHVLREKNKELYALEHDGATLIQATPEPPSSVHTHVMAPSQEDAYSLANHPSSIEGTVPPVFVEPAPSLAADASVSETLRREVAPQTLHAQVRDTVLDILPQEPMSPAVSPHVALHASFRDTLQASTPYRLKSSASASGHPLGSPLSVAQHTPVPTPVQHSQPPATHITQHLYIANQMLVQHGTLQVSPSGLAPMDVVHGVSSSSSDVSHVVAPPPAIESQEPDGMLTIPPEPPCNWILEDASHPPSLPPQSSQQGIPSPGHVPHVQAYVPSVASFSVPLEAPVSPEEEVNPFSDLNLPVGFDPASLKF
ncbi:MAG: DNA primase [Vampirovibrionales bacterium]